jgi:hypothetical protein
VTRRGPQSALKGQANGSLTYFGLAVDQDGKPLKGVTVEYQCEAFPSDWTFDKRGEPLILSKASATSSPDGRFQFTVDGHVLKRSSVVPPRGYRHFFEEDVGSTTGKEIPSTYGYLITSWGDRCYKSDPEHPAIFVFVKDGQRVVSALPCRGGFDSGNGTYWVENQPAWPRKPSLQDVERKSSGEAAGP